MIEVSVLHHIYFTTGQLVKKNLQLKK